MLGPAIKYLFIGFKRRSKDLRKIEITQQYIWKIKKTEINIDQGNNVDLTLNRLDIINFIQEYPHI